MDLALLFVWDRFLDALRRSDVDGATAFFAEDTRPRYRDVLLQLGDRMPEAADAWSRPRPVSVSGRIAQFLVTQQLDGANSGYILVFVRTEEGYWLISSL